MATLTKTCLDYVEIRNTTPDSYNKSSCDVGRYSTLTNNCFFDFDSINDEIPTGSKITSASLQLTQDPGGFSATLTAKPSLRTGAWDMFTWNTQAALSCDGDQFTLSGTAGGLRTIDVAKLVQWIVDNNSADHIFKLERIPNDASGTTDAKQFVTTIASHSLVVEYEPPTACGKPTSLGLSPSIAETTSTLSWSGSTAGTANAITGYEIQYCDSADGVTYGAWQALATVSSSSGSGSYTVNPPPTRGNYRRFQIRTLGAAGSAYYSDWSLAVTLRKNVLPVVPKYFSASPAVYDGGDIMLTWSEATAGTSAIKQYIIWSAASLDNGQNWSAYAQIAVINSSATSGSTTVPADTRVGVQVKYRIRVYDALGAGSAYYSISNTVQMNSAPPDPTILAPDYSRSSFNTKPRVLIKTGSGSFSGLQRVCVRIDGGAWQNSVDNASQFSVSGALAGYTGTIFVPGVALSVGQHTIEVKAMNEAARAESTTVSVTFSIAASPFSVITANSTRVSTAHMKELRDAVKEVRKYFGLAARNWQEEIVSGKTPVSHWSQHMKELRDAADDIVSFINLYDTSTGLDILVVQWIPFAVGRPKADAMQQLQNLILTL